MMLCAEADYALRTAYVELFWLATRLRCGEVSGHRALDIRAFAERTLREQRRALLRADVEDSIVDSAELAVIALLDESAQLSTARDCAEQWMARLLQYEHYQHSNLGRDFFDKLNLLRRSPETPLSLLELYARCLAWGFEGRYREENLLEELGVLRETLRTELLHRMPQTPLCPHKNELVAPPPAPPLFSAPWVMGLAAALVLAVGVLLTGTLYWNASATTAAIRALDAAKAKE